MAQRDREKEVEGEGEDEGETGRERKREPERVHKLSGVFSSKVMNPVGTRPLAYVLV